MFIVNYHQNNTATTTIITTTTTTITATTMGVTVHSAHETRRYMILTFFFKFNCITKKLVVHFEMFHNFECMA